jgi:hypothetical protein
MARDAESGDDHAKDDAAKVIDKIALAAKDEAVEVRSTPRRVLSVLDQVAEASATAEAAECWGGGPELARRRIRVDCRRPSDGVDARSDWGNADDPAARCGTG